MAGDAGVFREPAIRWRLPKSEGLLFDAVFRKKQKGRLRGAVDT